MAKSRVDLLCFLLGFPIGLILWDLGRIKLSSVPARVPVRLGKRGLNVSMSQTSFVGLCRVSIRGGPRR